MKSDFVIQSNAPFPREAKANGLNGNGVSCQHQTYQRMCIRNHILSWLDRVASNQFRILPNSIDEGYCRRHGGHCKAWHHNGNVGATELLLRFMYVLLINGYETVVRTLPTVLPVYFAFQIITVNLLLRIHCGIGSTYQVTLRITHYLWQAEACTARIKLGPIGAFTRLQSFRRRLPMGIWSR